MTKRAKEIGLRTVERPDTDPHLMVEPSMIEASISTLPSFVSTDPLPALKCGQFSSSRTCTYIQTNIIRSRAAWHEGNVQIARGYKPGCTCKHN